MSGVDRLRAEADAIDAEIKRLQSVILGKSFESHVVVHILDGAKTPASDLVGPLLALADACELEEQAVCAGWAPSGGRVMDGACLLGSHTDACPVTQARSAKRKALERIRGDGMKERPIIMTGPSIPALLDGSKTQTRRIVKHFPAYKTLPEAQQVPAIVAACPHGIAGDRLWVREKWCPASREHHSVADYPADGRPRDADGWWAWYAAKDDVDENDGRSPWKSPLFMPRWASRITLELTEVRVQRLQEITEEDARAEGVRSWPDVPDVSRYGDPPRWSYPEPKNTDECLGSARWAYASAWNDLHGHAGGKRARDAWDENPWVWALTFRRVTP